MEYNKVHEYAHVYRNFRYYSFECIWEKKKKLEVAVIKCSFAIPFRLYFSSFSSYENRNAKTSYPCVSTRVVCSVTWLTSVYWSIRFISLPGPPSMAVCKTRLLTFIEIVIAKKKYIDITFKFQISPPLLDYLATLINPRAYLRSYKWSRYVNDLQWS